MAAPVSEAEATGEIIKTMPRMVLKALGWTNENLVEKVASVERVNDYIDYFSGHDGMHRRLSESGYKGVAYDILKECIY